MADDKIKDKLRALLAKAEGTDNEHEAEIFMSKVNELLERHQLEMHEIRKDADPISMEKGTVKFSTSCSYFREFIFAVCGYYGGKALVSKVGGNFHYRIVGRDSVRTTIELMMPYIVTQLRRAGRRYAQTYGYSDSVAQREVAKALISRIYRETDTQDAHRSDLVGKGLIPVTDLDAFIEEKFPNVKEAKPTNLAASASAHRLAQGIALRAAADGTKTKLLT